MNRPNQNPNYIFTSFLGISHIFISRKSSAVDILACYGNLLNGEVESMSIETDFVTLNNLLHEAGEEADEAIEQIADLLSQHAEGNNVVDLSNSGGLNLHNHIFSFSAILNTDDEGKVTEPEQLSYKLNAYISRENILPDFLGSLIPTSINERSGYLNSILAMQYHIYNIYRKRKGENVALVYANLCDPLHFNLAKTQYELQKSGQANI